MIKRWFYKLYLNVKADYLSWKLKKALDKWTEADEQLKAHIEELRTFNKETIELEKGKYYYY